MVEAVKLSKVIFSNKKIVECFGDNFFGNG